MQLQKQLSKKVKDKEYAKWVVVVPPKQIKELGWKEGRELKTEIHQKKLIVDGGD